MEQGVKTGLTSPKKRAKVLDKMVRMQREADFHRHTAGAIEQKVALYRKHLAIQCQHEGRGEYGTCPLCGEIKSMPTEEWNRRHEQNMKVYNEWAASQDGDL